MHVDDHCRAIELIVKKGKAGDIYLIGGQTKEISNLEVAKTLLRIFEKDESYIEFVKDRPGHDRKYVVDWRKIKNELGWKPEHNFNKQLEETVDWYKENEWWWRPLRRKTERFYNKLDR